MGITNDEFAYARQGFPNDTLTLDSMNKASKGYAMKTGTGVLIGCLVFLALIAGFAAWCVLTA